MHSESGPGHISGPSRPACDCTSPGSNVGPVTHRWPRPARSLDPNQDPRSFGPESALRRNLARLAGRPSHDLVQMSLVVRGEGHRERFDILLDLGWTACP